MVADRDMQNCWLNQVKAGQAFAKRAQELYLANGATMQKAAEEAGGKLNAAGQSYAEAAAGMWASDDGDEQAASAAADYQQTYFRLEAEYIERAQQAQMELAEALQSLQREAAEVYARNYAEYLEGVLAEPPGSGAPQGGKGGAAE
jgi:hypothetical protein